MAMVARIVRLSIRRHRPKLLLPLRLAFLILLLISLGIRVTRNRRKRKIKRGSLTFLLIGRILGLGGVEGKWRVRGKRSLTSFIFLLELGCQPPITLSIQTVLQNKKRDNLML